MRRWVGLAGAGLAAVGAVGAAESLTRSRHAQADAAPAAPPPPPPRPGMAVPWPAAGHFVAFPGTTDIRARESYIVAYDRRTKQAAWVSQHLTAKSVAARNADRGASEFKEDPSIPPRFRSRLADYARSGYDRGHLCPAADAKTSQAAMDATFYLTNISPQVGAGFNRDYWARMEAFARECATRFGDAWVLSGPMFVPRQDPATKQWYVRYQVIGPSQVAVPTHFFKVIMVPSGGGKFAVGAFVLPNQPIGEDVPLTAFIVPVAEVERITGIQFLDAPIDVLARRPAAQPAAIEDLCTKTSCALPPPYQGKAKAKVKTD